MDCLTLKKSNCKNCYKCIRHCPVKAIRFTGNQAFIIGDECILCGQCFVVCPQDAKQIVDETEKVKVFMQSGEPVIVSLAPSFIANFKGSGIEAMRTALKKLGFFDVEETALGATYVKKEYEKMVQENQQDIIISSCCHSVNLLIQKHYPQALPYLAKVMSPMLAHCKDIKRRYPNAKTVFIGPCVAKKDEAQGSADIVDAVLTFDELSAWLEEAHVTIEKKEDDKVTGRARLFPTTSGVIRSMDQDWSKYTYMSVDGTQNCMDVLKDIEEGNIHNCFIEMSACVGSCVGGPVMEKFNRSPLANFTAVNRFAGSDDFDVSEMNKDGMKSVFMPLRPKSVMPTEEQIKNVLAQMGKTKKADELNCGSCGYDSCRAKAIAVFQGKAEISMCLPYLKEKAENLSDNVARLTPNALLVLNDRLEVQQINKAALKMFNLRNASDILGDLVVRVMDPEDILEVMDSGNNIHNKKVYLAEYEKYVEETLVYDQEYKNMVVILRDVTEEELLREKREEIKRQTVETADRVVDKQMRIVQEIASLLGETAAETKIALTKLKESIEDE